MQTFTNLHSSYVAGPSGELTLSDGSHLVLEAVVDGRQIAMMYIFGVALADGSHVSFDLRNIPALDGVFDHVSRTVPARLQALAARIGECFASRIAFLETIRNKNPLFTR